ncbi:hypothetical protein [Halorientalis sp.]|uniref:hypothetical protein n=1 Tax=Halorientalis sp. TaxID=1931229 RepID=UPI002614469B|nr:hypothetical protein [Halorientalis sp.]
MGSTPRIAVRYRDDRRPWGNAALDAAAADDQPPSGPVYLFDSQFHRSGIVCDARPRFGYETVVDHATRDEDHGDSLSLCRGEPGRILGDLPPSRVYLNRSGAGRDGRIRD